MAQLFVLQPNGLLAIFSSITDDFTCTDMTREEAIEVACETMGLSRTDAEIKVNRGLRDEYPWKFGTYGDGTFRWKETLKTIENVHGKAVRERIEMKYQPTGNVVPRTAWDIILAESE